MDKKRKSVLDFCHVYHENQSVSLQQFLTQKSWKATQCGLTKVPHLKNAYQLYYSTEIRYEGIVKSEKSNEVSLSMVPKGEKPAALLFFNLEGYSSYCKKYKAYWDWVEKRNEERYKTNQKHQKNYDSKNMMHTFRLLKMAHEIATEGKLQVQRSDRDYLLSIKEGKFEYDELLAEAERLKGNLKEAYQKADLPLVPDAYQIETILVKLRKDFYKGQ